MLLVNDAYEGELRMVARARALSYFLRAPEARLPSLSINECKTDGDFLLN
jgi:hypothetical protein